MNKWALIGFLCFLSVISAQAQNASPPVLSSAFEDVVTLEFVSHQTILVLDQKNHQLIELDGSGKVIDRIGNKGSGSYQFNTPSDLATTTGLKRFVADQGNQRIQLFDKRGQLLGSITNNASINDLPSFSPALLSVNNFGEVIAYDSDAKRILKFSENGALLDHFSLPKGIKSVDDIETSGAKLYILDKVAKVVHELTENGLLVSFYPAENTLAIRAKDDRIYLLKDTFVEYFQGSNRKVISTFSKIPDLRAFDFHKGILILATKNALYRLNYELED
jgi:hypothetical protein